jgi:hypothetical protein
MTRATDTKHITEVTHNNHAVLNMPPECMREKDTIHTTTSFNLVLNNLFNQLISGFILLLEPHHKPVKDEAGTNRGQNELSGRGVKAVVGTSRSDFEVK